MTFGHLEEYSLKREAFRHEVMAHKKNRQLALGENARLYFEDEITIRYQIQEMLRIEKVFDAAGIEDELGAYNPLIPDGQNWKATFMIEFGDPVERAANLAKMIGIDQCVWLQVGDLDCVRAITNEDLARETEEKTSSVHFMRFELSTTHITQLKAGAPLYAGIDHPAYRIEKFAVNPNIRDSLTSDLNQVNH